MLLSTLLGSLPPTLHPRIVPATSGAAVRAADPDVRRVTDRVQDAGPQDAFVAIRGARFDGHDHVPACAAAVLERPGVVPPGVLTVHVDSTARALGPLCAANEGHPSASMRVVGVTGTNGKTSVSYLVAHFARANGWSAGVIGTTGHLLDSARVGDGYTTPTAPQLQRLLAELRDRGADVVAMEVSSIGLAAHRVDGTRFRAVGYTNLTRDHLDYHGTMAAYAEAKARLFTELLPDDGFAVLNDRDPAVRALHEALAPLGPRARGLRRMVAGESTIAGTTLTVELPEPSAENVRKTRRAFYGHPRGAATTRTSLIGAYNIENIACAWELASCVGVPDEVMLAALPSFAGVPGRLERVTPVDHAFHVFVDYAHTDDALARVLAVLRPLTPGRLLLVFGCGGDRDPGKRAPMGAAARAADHVYVTSDNPRSEPPEAIIAAILPGLGDRAHTVELDRRAAIAAALGAARPGDVVLVAGKGHETTQTIGSASLPFDDREVARALLGRPTGAPS